MPIGTDFEIQLDKDIRYIGAAHGVTGAGYYSVIDFHRWLQALADDASSTGDDYMDITRDTPSDRSTDNIITLLNGYNIDQATAEHLYNGSIIQASGDDIWDGILCYANPGMDLQINQNGAILASDFWNSVPFGTGLKGINPDASNGISHRFMLKVRTSGTDIDGRRLIGQSRVWGKTFGEFKINGTSRGNNVLALTYADDLNNTTDSSTVATWTEITNETQGYALIDVDNNTVNEAYYSEWNRDSYTVNQLYERLKYLTRQESAATLYGLTGELFRGITHEITVDGPTGTFAPFELVTWSGGTGQMLAINSVTAPTKMWIQLLTGVAPTNDQVITGASTATATVNTTVTERTLSFPFCGVSTGSALIGAYGFGVEKSDLSASDKVFDLTNTQRQAPNYVTFVVGNTVAGDYIAVTPADGEDTDFMQFTLDGALTGSAVTSVVVNEDIPGDTPAAGQIRIQRANGTRPLVEYTSWAGKTFTIVETDFSSNNAEDEAGAYVCYIDTIALGSTVEFVTIFVSPRSLIVKARNGSGTPKIKGFQTAASLGAAGGGATVSRISDE